MKTINKHLYNAIFWISRFVTILVFGICLLIVLHIKYLFLGKYSYLISFFINENYFDLFINQLYSAGVYLETLPDTIFYLFCIFCNNSQNIDLLLISLILIVITSILTIKYISNKYQYMYISIFMVYITMYAIFKQQILLILSILTPIILIVIQILNKLCPLQKNLMLIPILGEIFCTKEIVKHIFNKSSKSLRNISLLVVVLITSNIICPFFLYRTDKDLENLIIQNGTYSIRIYQDKMIISGNGEMIVIDKNGNDRYIKNDVFYDIGYFVIDYKREQLYCCNFNENNLLITDVNTLNILKKISIINKNYIAARLCCNKELSKLIIVFETFSMSCIIDLEKYEIKYIKEIPEMNDGIIYNKYRNCFLLSFHDKQSFLQEIDVENKKMRKIKADKYQGYLAISERNKEIYVAFHQQGRIGVYDAETMKLKRKIKSSYTVKAITYDEELNILIAPSYFTGYVDIFLMDGSDKLITREFVGYGLREGCFDSKKENLYVCSMNGLYKKKIDIKKLIEEHSNNKNTIL